MEGDAGAPAPRRVGPGAVHDEAVVAGEMAGLQHRVHCLAEVNAGLVDLEVEDAVGPRLVDNVLDPAAFASPFANIPPDEIVIDLDRAGEGGA